MFVQLRRFIQYLENTSAWNCMAIILSCIFIRIFFEAVLERTRVIGYAAFSYRALLQYFIHFPFFYLSTLLLIIMIISLVTRTGVINVLKAASVSMVLIVLVPVMDALIGRGYMLTYPLRLEQYITHFLNPFVSLSIIGVSPGQRIIIFIIAVISGLYCYMKTKSAFRSLVLALAVFAAILFMGALTTLIAMNRPEFLYVRGGVLGTDTQKFSMIYGLVFAVCLFIFLYLVNKKFFALLCRSMRLERMVFYGGLGIFGFVLSGHISGTAIKSDIFSLLGVLAILLCLAFAFWSLQIFNDFCDRVTDAVARGRNPLLKGIGREYYFASGMCVALYSLAIAMVVNYIAFLIILTMFLLGIVYSAPPLRLKRVPVLATFILAVAVVLSMAFGFSVHYGEKAISAIPTTILIPTLIGITIGFISKDINDAEGDRIDGVLTIPIVLNSTKSIAGKIIMAIIIGMSFMVYAFFIPRVLAGAAAAFVMTFLYTALAKEPREWFYFVVLYGFGAYLLYILLA